MNDAEFRKLLSDCVSGNISQQQHQALQQTLQSDPEARAAFREFMDLEASLHTWATEDATSTTHDPHGVSSRALGQGRRLVRGRPFYSLFAVAVSITMLAVVGWFWWEQSESPQRLAEPPRKILVDPLALLGTASRQEACVWNSENLTTGSRFAAGTLSLASGVAELKFDSATDVVMEGPCELQVASADTARLLAGNVVVHVSELSDGFTLKTPDATIIDEGTEYAVSLDEEATEVHVFDGSVFWEPVTDVNKEAIERIEAGEARRYLRSKPSKGARIPLKKVRFVRRLEADVRENAGAVLLAYDGFENLAGRVQRGRSGFGWSGGWKAGFRGHGKVGTIVDAPDDTVFGTNRTRRRLLQIAHGEVMRRDLEQAVPLDPGDSCYLSFILQRHREEADSGRYLQVSLYNTDEHPRRRSRNELAFGITSDGFPFVKSGGKITQSAPSIEDDTVHLLVAKMVVSNEHSVETYLRVYRNGEPVERHEPSAWSTVGQPSPCEFDLSRVRLTAGDNALFDIDELRIGKTWRSVTAMTAGAE